MSKKLRIVVSGLIAQYPLGGVTWFYLQYALGLSQLGHDVYYVEDSGQWPYNPAALGLIEDCTFNIEYLSSVMSRFGLGDRWAYRYPQSRWFGLSGQKREEVMESADLVINVSGSLIYPEDFRNARLLLLDTDPVFTQVKLARGQVDFQRFVDTHHVHFTFAECLSDAVPATGHRWQPTRTPVVMAEWRTSMPHRETFTTVMSWTSYNPVTFNGETYGQKDVEFKQFMDLPQLVAPTEIELAIGPGNTKQTPYELLRYKGWRLVDPNVVCPDLDSFRAYTESSKAEFSVAKNGYVKGRPGWFSERSARYLAAGRPVVVQDTGFGGVLPTGEGLLPFHTIEEAAAAIREVEGNYDRHSKAARAIAENYFDSAKVLDRLLEEAMSNSTSVPFHY